MTSAAQCANCLDPVAAGRPNGPPVAVAWMWHCRPCAELAASTLKLLAHEPTGAHIDIWHCTRCDTLRAGRPGWRTRCHLCLDERSVLEEELRRAIVDDLQADPEWRTAAADAFAVPEAEVTAEEALWVYSLSDLGQALDAVERPGWRVLAVDVWGMPWVGRQPRTTHGSWGIHEACGTVARLGAGRAACPVCPPEKGARSQPADADQAQTLYLVRYKDLLRFGHGDSRRVQTQVRAGCEVVAALRASHAQVVAAEAALKALLRDDLIDPDQWDLPRCFGKGTEVVPDDVDVPLGRVLAGPEVADVTHLWRT